MKTVKLGIELKLTDEHMKTFKELYKAYSDSRDEFGSAERLILFLDEINYKEKFTKERITIVRET